MITQFLIIFGLSTVLFTCWLVPWNQRKLIDELPKDRLPETQELIACYMSEIERWSFSWIDVAHTLPTFTFIESMRCWSWRITSSSTALLNLLHPFLCISLLVFPQRQLDASFNLLIIEFFASMYCPKKKRWSLFNFCSWLMFFLLLVKW